ncbi:MAG: aminodeoxychorismate/anthranilate synthase component II [Propionibacteriaceae bacterium]|nr:aminodeoxychorismate/anthranilate synthase component II [Propionibacteriaceae bacterium]
MIALIDNYDSFTFNLYQLIGELNPDLRVFRNDALSVAELAALQPSHIVLSPGPGHPRDAGICIDVVKSLSGQFPILGVCLGHQAICQAFGATVSYAKTLMHGKASAVSLAAPSVLFAGLPEGFLAARYHSLAADPATIPADLVVTAVADDEEVMAVEHARFPTYGVQFHPESVLTPLGKTILRNFAQTTV